MTLKKSEKILLQILVLVAAFALILVFWVMPEAERKIRLKTLSDALDQELDEKQQLLLNPQIDERYQEEKQKAEENYDYFYSVLNGYSIDEIINSIAQEKQLSITSLNIGEYIDASTDFQLVSEENLDVLVKSTVSLTVLGSYQNILGFMEALNEKSTCLRMSLVSINENRDDATGSEGMSASFRIYIYGIDVELDDTETVQGNEIEET